MSKVTLQINLHPLDAPHAVHTLPHQLRTFAGQVDEVLLSIDLQRSQGSRYRTDAFEARMAELVRIVDRARAASPKVRALQVMNTPEQQREVSMAFHGHPDGPARAENGSPFHAYLHGVFHASHDLVLHLDSDMLFGGGSQTWVAEACQHLASEPTVLACNPLAGPPRPDGRTKTRVIARGKAPYPAYYCGGLSTRIFLLDRRRIMNNPQARVPLVKAPPGQRLQALINYTSPYVALEDCLTEMMRMHGWRRLDFLGSGSGLWSVHPVYRSEAFYQALPQLIDRIERGDVPDAQRGDYDLHDAMFDFSDVRAARTWAVKFRRTLEYAAAGLSSRAKAWVSKPNRPPSLWS